MSNVDALNDLIRGLLRTTMSWPANSFRPAYQIGPTGNPPEQFATVLVATVTPLVDPVLSAVSRWQDVVAPSTNVQQTVLVQQQIMASVNFFRGDAMMNATTLSILMESAVATEAMQKVGLGLISCSSIRNLTALADAIWEPRAQLDILFTVVSYAVLTIATYNDFRFQTSTERATSIKEILTP